jgi:uncharacterized protein (TIGR04255 family)
MGGQSSSTDQCSHPTYPNPIIIEALCEINFGLAHERGWDPTCAGELFKRIQDEFPRMEPWPLVLQLGANVLTINVLSKYPGWDVVRQDILNAWQHLCEVCEPAVIRRLDLRYINQVPKRSPDERAQEWFKPTDYLPAAALRSPGPFLAKVECQVGPSGRASVTLAEVELTRPEPAKAIVLDIERIEQKDMSVQRESLRAELERLHDDVWKIFAPTRTDRLVRYMKEGSHE